MTIMFDFNDLHRFDPEMAARLADGFGRWPRPPDPSLVDALAGDILKGLSVEPTFGQALADGVTEVIRTGTPAAVARYRECVAQFADVGPTLGRIMARALVPVTVQGDDAFLGDVLSVVVVMRRKGTHTLTDPLNALGAVLAGGDLPAAAAYLKLLSATFSRSLTYNRATHLTKHLPRAVLCLQPAARAWQIDHLTTAMIVSDWLAERLWESLVGGDLRLLSNDGLRAFVDDACRRFQRDPEEGLVFAAMRSQQGRDACAALRVAVPLTEVRGALSAYASLRLGRGCAIRSMSDLPAAASGDQRMPLVCSDGRAIYLADVMDSYPEAPQNRALYQCLVRLECAVLESGTYDFDMDKAADRLGAERPVSGDGLTTDIACWLLRYASPPLAAYLFSAFEYARIYLWSRSRYPGALRQAVPFLETACRQTMLAWPEHPFTPLAVWPAISRRDHGAAAVIAAMGAFDAVMTEASTVEDTMVFLDGVYPSLSALIGDAASGLPDLPFGRRILPEGHDAGLAAEHREARRIQQTLARRGVSVYRSELIRQYRDGGNTITPEGVRQAVSASARCAGTWALPAVPMRDGFLSVDDLFSETVPSLEADTLGDPVYRYPEWDGRQGDYRGDHVKVRVGTPAVADATACAVVLRQRQDLVARIRRAFELLRPQGLILLRRWMEGDDFDYRALLDFAVDRRSGRTPSERVYLKRLKAHRDVATLLLVDQSRSTAHPALGSPHSVMDVEKAAIVLFCEALGVLGDRFAVAGFSGTGRLGVDYFWIKTFDEPMGTGVWGRIAGMAPLRSTRMGAAIRHATASFESAPAAVRLLIVLGDGFPNDVDYKKGYAIEDTRKAIQEAHARHIYTHGITVNIASDAGLDALYGGSAHTVISDVRELPDALWRVYANLTRR
ncbi:MAG: hypothetical protein ABIL58_18630 [Pseudomonadota bacterium]